MDDALLVAAVALWVGAALSAALIAGRQALSISILAMLLLLGPLGLVFVINLRYRR